MANSGCLLLSNSGSMLPHSVPCPPAFLYLQQVSGPRPRRARPPARRTCAPRHRPHPRSAASASPPGPRCAPRVMAPGPGGGSCAPAPRPSAGSPGARAAPGEGPEFGRRARNFSEGAGGVGGRSLGGSRRGGGGGSQRPGHFGELRVWGRGGTGRAAGLLSGRVGKSGGPRGGGGGGGGDAELCCSGDCALGRGGGGPPAWWGRRGRPRELRREGVWGQTLPVCGAAQEGRVGEEGRTPSDPQPPHPQDTPRGGAHRKSAASCPLARVWGAGVQRKVWSQGCIGDGPGISLPPPRSLGLLGLRFPVLLWPEPAWAAVPCLTHPGRLQLGPVLPPSLPPPLAPSLWALWGCLLSSAPLSLCVGPAATWGGLGLERGRQARASGLASWACPARWEGSHRTWSAPWAGCGGGKQRGGDATPSRQRQARAQWSQWTCLPSTSPTGAAEGRDTVCVSWRGSRWRWALG